jgi:hypothetical protein
MRRSAHILGVSLSLAVAVLPAFAGAVFADNPPAPDPQTQPLDDGCHRDPAGFLAFTEPEWVYVYRNPAIRVAEGTVNDAHTAGGDLPEGHDWYDLNSDLKVDPAYQYLLAGNEDDPGHLHVEWETGTVPTYAWPTDGLQKDAGDGLKVWGSWIWDCGHWGQSFTDPDYFLPGSQETNHPLRGEQTEFHPMLGMVVTRNNPYLPQVEETEGDVFISNEGTTAKAEEDCTLKFPSPYPLPYSPAWTACAHSGLNQRQDVNSRNYSFFIPAPPDKPSPDSQVRYRVEDRGVGGSGPQEQVQVLGDGIQVTVPFKGFGGADQTLRYGKSFFVGWTGDDQNRPAHIQVTFKSIKIVNSLDDPQQPAPPNPPDTSAGVPPGEWNMYVDVNGYWKLLNEWIPGLDSVNSGDVLNINKTIDLHVPQGQGVRLLAVGRECDLPKIKPCPATSEVAEDNDDPGTKADVYSSPEAASNPEDHVLKPSSDNYELSYKVHEVSPATTGPGPCTDTFLPRSRIARSGAHVVNGRFVFAGTAADRDCSGDGVAPRSVKVSVARVVPPSPSPPPGHHEHDRCQFLQRSGSFSTARACPLIGFLTAHGTSTWSFVHRANITPGDYLVRTRAVDRAGNVEYANLRRNRLVVSVP